MTKPKTKRVNEVAREISTKEMDATSGGYTAGFSAPRLAANVDPKTGYISFLDNGLGGQGGTVSGPHAPPAPGIIPV